MATGKKLGRPTKAAKAGERASLGLRVTAEIKEKLEQAAEASGRSQSQEAELRLERSFEEERRAVEIFGGPQLHALMRLIASSIEIAVLDKRLKLPSENVAEIDWLNDPDVYDILAEVVIRVLEDRRPTGAPGATAEPQISYAEVRRNYAIQTVTALLLEIAAPDAPTSSTLTEIPDVERLAHQLAPMLREAAAKSPKKHQGDDNGTR